MWPNPQFPADLVTFTEKSLNKKLHLLYNEACGAFVLGTVFKTSYLKNNSDSTLRNWKGVNRNSRPGVFLGKGVLKICSKFTGEHPCQSAISIKLWRNLIEITHWHGCSAVNLLHIFRTPFLKNPSGRMLLSRLLGKRSFPFLKNL